MFTLLAVPLVIAGLHDLKSELGSAASSRLALARKWEPSDEIGHRDSLACVESN